MMKFILYVLFGMGATAHAGTADIVYCKNGAGVSLQVTVVSTSAAVFTSVQITSGGKVTEYINRDAIDFDPTAMTLFALDDEVTSAGVLGRGVMLNVEGQTGYLARAGKIEILNCREGGGTE